jgi:hypothetical protein
MPLVVTGTKLNPRLAPMSASGGCERKLNGGSDLPFETSREVSIIEPECGFQMSVAKGKIDEARCTSYRVCSPKIRLFDNRAHPPPEAS